MIILTDKFTYPDGIMLIETSFNFASRIVVTELAENIYVWLKWNVATK